MRHRRIAAAVIAAATCVVVTATPAAAHARLLRTDPAAGSTVGPSLTSISLEFDDTIKLLPRALLVTGATGAPLATAAPRVVRGRVLEVALLDRLVAGRYYVGWRILADDGHVVSGSFGFVVATGTGVTGAPTPAAASSLPPPTQPLWPVIAAAGLAMIAIAGAALVVRRGLQVVALTPVEPYPTRHDAARHAASAEEHPASLD